MEKPLTGREQEAAQFAAETEVAGAVYKLSNDYSPEMMQRYNERVVRTYFYSEPLWQGSKTKWRTTGGIQWKVLDSTQSESGYRVTLCEFDTPGIYDIIDGKPVHGPDAEKSISAEWATVAWTTEPSALDSHNATTPRPLITSIVSAVGYQNPGTLCDKYAPDPFVQQPPDPIQPGQK